MNWHQRLDILRWRSLEEADAAADCLSLDRRREATARTRGDLRADGGSGEAALAAFLERRAAWLDAHADARQRDVLRSMTVTGGRWSWALAGWLLALCAGFGLTGIGSEREINLLSLPLVGLLIWNVVVMAGSVVFELAGRRRASDSGRFSYLDLRSGAGGRKTPDAVHVETFRRYAGPLNLERTTMHFRAWLHIAAAVLALGSCAGMYAKGWSREYRAVWESTLLKPQRAASFFSTLFWPASTVLGVTVPVDDLPRMQRTGGKVDQPADALPWIHLYAGTLILLVSVPRIVLAGWTHVRGARRIERQWRDLGWDAHVNRLLRAVEGGDEIVQVLLHGVADNGENRSRWTTAVQEKAGGMSRMEMQSVPSGDEDEFAAAWIPGAHLVVILFQLATTPEEEVQRKLAADLGARLHERFADGKFVALIDASGARERWTPAHLESRRQLWRKTLQGVTDELEFIGEERDANHLRVPVSKAR